MYLNLKSIGLGLLLHSWAIGGDGAAVTTVLFEGCDTASPIAEIPAGTPVRVRFSLAGESTPCWAVTATHNGRQVQGYVFDRQHPAIAAFERDTTGRVPAIPPPPPPPPPAEKAPEVDEKGATKPGPAPALAPEPMPESFSGFRAVDIGGNRVDLGKLKAKTVILYFWSPESKRDVKDIDTVGYVNGQYGRNDLVVIGIATGSSADTVRQACSQNEALWPQVLDRRGQIAQEYNVNPEKRYLVLDENRDVIAAVARPSELSQVLQKRIR